jgi:hypothetical protein
LGGFGSKGAIFCHCASVSNGPDRAIHPPSALLTLLIPYFQKLNHHHFNRLSTVVQQLLVKSAPRTASMNIPNFHDGHFDGLRIGPSKLVNLFLRTQDGKSFIMALQEVDALRLSEIKQGNIILDLVFRSTGELTRSDMAELYSVDVNAPQATDLLRVKRKQGFQLLEINPSYGAQGLVLFKTFEIRQSSLD